MKICSNCVMPETSETLIFSENNKCSVCYQIEKKGKIDWKNRSKLLDKLIEKHRGKYDYDCIVPFSGGKDSTFIDSLIAGTYHLSITDTFGCTFNDTISLIEPTVISLVNHSKTNVSCNGYLDGSFSVFVNGGVPDYTVNGQPNINNIDTIVFNNISAGSYIFNIIDQNGCVLADSVIVTEPAIMTPILSISNYNGVNISCKGFTDGFIMIDTIIGGNSPYNISWTDLQNGNSINNANSLTVGLYNLTIIF